MFVLKSFFAEKINHSLKKAFTFLQALAGVITAESESHIQKNFVLTLTKLKDVRLYSVSFPSLCCKGKFDNQSKNLQNF